MRLPENAGGAAAQGMQPHGTALGTRGSMAGVTVTHYDA
jgi:hypothetical protein